MNPDADRVAFQRDQLRRVRPLLGDVALLLGPFVDARVGQPAWRTRDGMVLMAGIEPRPEQDGVWYHVSYSRDDRIPDHADTLLVRRTMFKRSALVVAIFPPMDEYVNLFPTCLHLWQRLEPADRLIPDLRIVDDGITAI